MTRHDLLPQLDQYKPSCEETTFRQDLINLIKTSGKCFYRDHFVPGHVTGSGILLNQSATKILMNHHKSLNKWLCFGGHADGQEDILAVALREVIEESGAETVTAISKEIFDIDIHVIPENLKKGEPQHRHYDIRYLFRAGTDNFTASDESLHLKWCDFEEARGLAASADMDRMINKIHRYNIT